jgi:hypothetical protein
MCLRRAPEEYIMGAALDRAVLNTTTELKQRDTNIKQILKEKFSLLEQTPILSS